MSVKRKSISSLRNTFSACLPLAASWISYSPSSCARRNLIPSRSIFSSSVIKTLYILVLRSFIIFNTGTTLPTVIYVRLSEKPEISYRLLLLPLFFCLAHMKSYIKIKIAPRISAKNYLYFNILVSY